MSVCGFIQFMFILSVQNQFHLKYFPLLILQILRNAVSKTYNRITDLRKEISSLKKGVISAEEAASKAKSDLEAAESKLTLVEGEPVLGENPARLKRLKTQAEKAKEEEISICDTLEAKEALLARALDENEVLDATNVTLIFSNNIAILRGNFVLVVEFFTTCSRGYTYTIYMLDAQTSIHVYAF